MNEIIRIIIILASKPKQKLLYVIDNFEQKKENYLKAMKIMGITKDFLITNNEFIYKPNGSYIHFVNKKKKKERIICSWKL